MKILLLSLILLFTANNLIAENLNKNKVAVM